MEVILIGGFIETIELCESCDLKILGIVDNTTDKSIQGYKVLGNDADANKLFEKYPLVKLVITPDSPIIRKKLVNLYSEIGFSFQNVISPNAEISKSAIIGQGVIIQSGVNISSKTVIGDFVKLNTKSNIMHESLIADYVTVAPNAVILGRVQVGQQSYIGANSTILPYLIIQSEVTVGAGAVVVKNIDKGKTVIGVPAK